MATQALLLLALSLLQEDANGSATIDRAALDRAISLAVDARYEDALEIFQAELRKSPDDPLLNYYVGMTQHRLERFTEAVAHLEKSIRKKAPFPQAFLWLARSYLAREMEEKARAILARGLERFPRNEDLLKLAQELGGS